ncbi:hypothetical protein DQG13_28950 [Paenibacillus sp. YN15]|nr:hypothetical protein DQG13_28950 [Paenibacillus sp. YN15]
MPPFPCKKVKLQARTQFCIVGHKHIYDFSAGINRNWKVRLEKAKELLAGTDMRINAIAELVGYQPTYFNRIFKKLEGITPGAYRESAGTPENSWEESSQGGHPL